jgi:hypothetical protein
MKEEARADSRTVDPSHLADGRSPHVHAPSRGDWAFTAALFLLCLIVCFAFAQSCLHWFDSVLVLQNCRDGNGQHHWHLLGYRPMVWLHERLSPWGVGVRSSCELLMAFGGAATAAFAHRTALARGLSVDASRMVGLLVAATPAVHYYATMVELQALEMAAAGAALWALVALGRVERKHAKAGLIGAALLGLVSALASAVHSSLHMLPLVFPWLALAGMWPRASWRVVLTQWSVAFLVVALSHWLCYRGLLWLANDATVALGTERLLTTGVQAPVYTASVGQRVLGEIVLPFFPCSLVFLYVLVRQPTRERVALLCGLVGVLLATMLALRGVRTDENGAYMLYFAAPLAMATVQIVPRRSQALLLAAAVAGAMLLRWKQADARRDEPELAQACREIAEQRNCAFLTGEGPLLDSLTLHAPDLKVIGFPLHQPVEEHLAAEAAYGFDLLVGLWKPRDIVIDERTWAQWSNGKYGAMRVIVNDHIPKTYGVEPIVHGLYRGYVVPTKGK